MNYKIRKANKQDYKDILMINASLVHFLSPMDHARLTQLDHDAALHEVVELDGKVVAFLLAFREKTDYDSVNYQWFNNKYDAFLYVDRIVIHENFHGLGIGKALYKFVQSYAKEENIPRITAEIDVKPENPTSLAFHKKSGFLEVGQQSIYQGKKVVSLQCLDL